MFVERDVLFTWLAVRRHNVGYVDVVEGLCKHQCPS